MSRHIGRARCTPIAACTLLCALALCARSTRADAHDVVALELPDCQAIRAHDVTKLVELELLAGVRLKTAPDELATIRVRVTCGMRHVELEAEDAAQARTTRVRIDLQAVAPEARARLLALSVAELIATTRLERAGKEPAPAPGPGPFAQNEPDPLDSDAASEPAASAVHLFLTPSLGSAFDPLVLMMGASAGSAVELWHPLAIAADLSARFGSTEVGSAALSARLLSASVSAQLEVLRRPRLALGPGLRAGHAHLAGDPNGLPFDSGSVNELWLGPFAGASLLLPLMAPAHLRLALEAGYVARRVVGLDQLGDDLLALRGPWLAAELGLALEL